MPAEPPDPIRADGRPLAVLLDLDETLISDEAAVQAALAATLRSCVPELAGDDAAVAEAVTTVRAAARERWRALPTVDFARRIGISSWEAMVATFAAPGSAVAESFAELAALAPAYRLDAWTAGLAETGVGASASAAAACAARFPAERHRTFRLLPDAVDVLPRLVADHPVAIVTNGAPDLQHAKVAACGAGALVSTVVVSGDVGVGKPDPAPLLVALEALGVRPEDAVMVGDSLRNDVGGAAAAGCRSVWLDRWGRGAPPPGAPVPDVTLPDLTGLVEELARW